MELNINKTICIIVKQGNFQWGGWLWNSVRKSTFFVYYMFKNIPLAVVSVYGEAVLLESEAEGTKRDENLVTNISADLD
jgi:hypothetical protein